MPRTARSKFSQQARCRWRVSCRQGAGALDHDGVPLSLVALPLGLMLNCDIEAYPALAATLLAGTPAISFIGSIGAALTLRAGRGGLLIALLILPLYIPTLIFGISTMAAVITPPGNFWASLSILAAISLASVVLAPIAAAAALRTQIR